MPRQVSPIGSDVTLFLTCCRALTSARAGRAGNLSTQQQLDAGSAPRKFLAAKHKGRVLVEFTKGKRKRLHLFAKSPAAACAHRSAESRCTHASRDSETKAAGGGLTAAGR